MSLLWKTATDATSEPDPSEIQERHSFGGPLFHGSDEELSPGDIIGPRSKKIAHATPEIRTAKVFGKNVYHVEPVKPGTNTFTRRMKYDNDEGHYETVSTDGFRVSEKIPRSRKDSYYDPMRQEAVGKAQDWAERHGASWCFPDHGWHTPNHPDCSAGK